MRTFRMIGMALVAMMLTFGLSSCNKDNDSFIEVDYTQDLVGTWTCLEVDFACALVINADGSAVATSLLGDDFRENVKGTVKVENNKISWSFEDGQNFDGRFEMIPGETLSVIDTKTDRRVTYRYCEKDLSNEIVGYWVCNDAPTNADNDMLIHTFTEDGKAIFTGYADALGGNMNLNIESSYKVIGDLFVNIRPAHITNDNVPSHIIKRLIYSPDGTALGDIMTFEGYQKIDNEMVLTAIPYLRVKQYLELPGQKYDYIKTYITNVKGLDQDFHAGDFILNFSKLDGKMFNKMLKTLLFNIEFPDANTMQYSYTYNGETVSSSANIEVDGNKMTVNMDKTHGHFRDMDLYAFQDKDNTQMHIYMSRYAFINYFGNIAISLLEANGEIDPHNQEAVDAVFNELTTIIEAINISFIMSKSE